MISILREREPGGFTNSTWRWALVGAAALVPALAVAYAMRRWAHGLLLPELAAQYVIERVPGPFALWAISTLGKAAKPVGLIIAFGCFYAAAAVFGFYFKRTYEVLPGASLAAKGLSFGCITLLMTFALLGIVYFTAPGALGQYHFLPALASILLFNLIFGLSLAFASRWAREEVEPIADASSPALSSETPVSASRSRRAFLAGIGVAVASLGLVALIARDLLDYVGTGIGTLPGRLPSFLTPNRDFYVVQKEVGTPLINEREWQLRVEGHVEHPFVINYDEVERLARDERTITLQCIENQIGGPLISNARWRGVMLRTLLERAGVREGARRVVVWGAGHYADSIPLEKATDPNVILAVEMNGEPLPRAHGYPLRLLTPGLYGIKNVKWVERIEVVTVGDFKGYWQERGWSAAATVKTASKISVPVDDASLKLSFIEIGGVAFAGERGVSRVEVSADGGRTWEPTVVVPDALSEPTSWVVWTHAWIPRRTGDHTLVVRATDGRGELQTPDTTHVFPDGASGYHRITVHIS